MRMLLKMHMPVAEGNRAIADGSFGRVVEPLIERLQPETSYFFTEGGERTGYIVFDLQQPADIPVVCEPLFTVLNARVEMTPVMNLSDVQEGLSRAQQGDGEGRAAAAHQRL